MKKLLVLAVLVLAGCNTTESTIRTYAFKGSVVQGGKVCFYEGDFTFRCGVIDTDEERSLIENKITERLRNEGVISNNQVFKLDTIEEIKP